MIEFLKSLFSPRCSHQRIRCIHGDEIIVAGYRRSACLDCPAVFDNLPEYCTVTGDIHPSFKTDHHD